MLVSEPSDEQEAEESDSEHFYSDNPEVAEPRRVSLEAEPVES
jgi:hypothetical protein